MGALSPTHWLIIIAVLVVLFGSTRLPGAARGLGQSLRIFKSEIKEMKGDGGKDAQTNAPTSGAQQQLPASSPEVRPTSQPQSEPHEHRSA